MVGIRLVKPRKKIAKRQLELRSRLWPDITEADLWTRDQYNGFTTIPKTMPLMMSIMDDLANGQPVSSTYLELWCRTFDENFVTLSKPREISFHAGFTTQRGERTWRARLKILEELGFIRLKEGASGPATYALILNPYRVIKALYESGHPGVREDKYNALHDRAIEVDDDSLNPAPPAPPVPPTPDVIVTPPPPAASETGTAVIPPLPPITAAG